LQERSTQRERGEGVHLQLHCVLSTDADAGSVERDTTRTVDDHDQQSTLDRPGRTVLHLEDAVRRAIGRTVVVPEHRRVELERVDRHVVGTGLGNDLTEGGVPPGSLRLRVTAVETELNQVVTRRVTQS